MVTEEAVVAPTRNKRRRLSHGAWKAYLFLLPTLFILGVFVYYPIIESFRLSLHRVAPFGLSQEIFVGFEQYTNLFDSPQFWNTVWVSLWFMIGTVPFGIALAVVIAILLAVPVRRMSWLHRMMIFVPVVISSAVAAVMFRWLYNPVVGHLNTWIGGVGLEGPNWLTSTNWALLSVIITVVWRNLGFNVIIALAGLQNIDESLYEAAKVDGAGVWQRTKSITLPMLSPTLFFLLIVNIITSLQTFGEINILTDGGPGRATTNLIYSVYVDAFVGTPLRGRASAQAFMLAIIIIIISVANFRGFGKKVHYQ